MNVPSAVVLALIGGLGASAATNRTVQPSVKICVAGDDNTSVRLQAESMASQMFADIGITLEWYHDNRHCKTPLPEFINISLSKGAPESEFPGALAYTHLHENPYTEVFFDRVIGSVERTRVPKLLAHVLAHEIVHALTDTGHHSGGGIMKAHWDAEDLFLLSYRPFSFTQEDAELIRRGLALRP